jgi:hypothetical protein
MTQAFYAHMNNKKIKIKKTKNQKTKGLRFGSSSGVPAHQAQGPGFDPQNCQNKNKQTNKQTNKKEYSKIREEL